MEGVLAGEGCGELMQGHSQILAVQVGVGASVVEEEEQSEIEEPDPTLLVQRPRRSERVRHQKPCGTGSHICVQHYGHLK